MELNDILDNMASTRNKSGNFTSAQLLESARAEAQQRIMDELVNLVACDILIRLAGLANKQLRDLEGQLPETERAYEAAGDPYRRALAEKQAFLDRLGRVPMIGPEYQELRQYDARVAAAKRSWEVGVSWQNLNSLRSRIDETRDRIKLIAAAQETLGRVETPMLQSVLGRVRLPNL